MGTRFAIFGINDSGQIVGYFSDGTRIHGFLATPVPEPSNSLTLATGLVALFADGPLWLDVIDALPKTLAEPLVASVKSSEPSNSAIKQHIANGGVVEGASGYHLRIE